MEALTWILLGILGVAIVWASRHAVARFWRSQNNSQTGSSSRPSWRLERQLIKSLNGDRKAAYRLVERLKLRNPGRPENWYWEKAIYDLHRDRRF